MGLLGQVILGIVKIIRIEKVQLRRLAIVDAHSAGDPVRCFSMEILSNLILCASSVFWRAKLVKRTVQRLFVGRERKANDRLPRVGYI